MRSIGFSFNPDVSTERQESVLAQINDWDEVKLAKRLQPTARDSDVARMAYAYIEDDADATELTIRLNRIPEIDGDSIAPHAARGLG
jgi:hypothetical protein